MTSVHFFFEIASPYCYIASRQIDSIVHRFGREVEWRPIDLEKVWSDRGVLDAYAAIRRLKHKYIAQDSQRCAAAVGLTMMRPVTPARETCFAKLAFYGLRERDPELAQRFIRAAWDRHFAEGGPISNSLQLSRVGGLSVGAQALEDAAASPHARTALDQSTADAVLTGCFGVPWIAVDGEVFFGHDRLPELERLLGGRVGISASK